MQSNMFGWLKSIIVFAILLVIAWFVFKERFNIDLLTNPSVCSHAVATAKQVSLLQFDSRIKILQNELATQSASQVSPTVTSVEFTNLLKSPNTADIIQKILSGNIAELAVNELSRTLVSLPTGPSQAQAIAEKRQKLSELFESAIGWCATIKTDDTATSASDGTSESQSDSEDN